MAKNATKTEEIKIRIEPLTKFALVQIAGEEDLDLSDIARKAIREFLQRRPSTKPELVNA